MKYLKTFNESINENIDTLTDTLTDTTIENLVDKLNFPSNIQEKVINWWNTNRSGFELDFFPFNTNQPILDCFLGGKKLAINSKGGRMVPKEILLFVALHESCHADQYKEGRFENGYFNSVINDNKEQFVTSYKELEKEANDYGLNGMKEMGFDIFVKNASRWGLRDNEFAYDEVYEMMKKDIEKYKPNNFVELLLKQIK